MKKIICISALFFVFAAVAFARVPGSEIKNGAFSTAFDGNSFLVKRIAYDANDNPEYVGVAPGGTLVSQTKWRIEKFTYTGTLLTSSGFPDGNAGFAYEWDERAGYTYK